MASPSTSQRTVDPVVSHLLKLAQQAARLGDLASAEHLCNSVMTMDPSQPAPYLLLIPRALESGDADRALRLARQGIAHGLDHQLQFLLGCALEASGDPAGARDAFATARAIAPDSCLPPLYQGAQEEAMGQKEAWIRHYEHALALAKRSGILETPSVSPQVVTRLRHAADAVDRVRAEAVEAALAPVRERHGPAAIARIEQAAAIYLGDAEPEWPHPLQRPTFLLIPGLVPQPWFARGDFPFLSLIEARTDAIRSELRALLADAGALSPYVDMPDHAPAAAVWNELNRSTRWSSYHLFRHGEAVAEHCRRCPETYAALQSIPLMRIPEHSPEAVFSLLKARTHIPPHTGVINGRLTVHLPLVVPADCGALKVGGEQHGWTIGECLVFDDSFVHEAWNDTDQDRVVLIFDIWDPRLSDAEREAVSALIAGIGRFNRAYCADDASVEMH